MLCCQVQFHPRNDKMFLVCPMRHAAVLVDTDGDHRIVPLDDDVSTTVKWCGHQHKLEANM